MSNKEKLQQMQLILSVNRSLLPSVSSERAYAQQARSLQGMTREPSNGGLFAKALSDALKISNK